MGALDGDEIAGIRSALLAWFDVNRRDLPWRSGPGEVPDPYRVWLSEVMLQQTRVETVRPYYHRWLDRFPTLSHLAAADIDEVLKAWEGLGYYSRARNFHAAVREVSARYRGTVPDDPSRFRALPGVGDYTAGAVMSIAFDREEPAVDGNVRRVFARLLDQEAPRPVELRALAARLAVGERPGDLNQALMELGATICTPRKPACDACPIRSWCAARKCGTQLLRPAPRKRPPLPIEDHGVAAIRGEDSRFLMTRRPPGGRLGGLWEFPGSIGLDESDAAASAGRAALDSAGAPAEVGERVGVVEHAFSHVRVRYHVFLTHLTVSPERQPAGGAPPPDPATRRWIRLPEVGTLAIPRAHQRIARLLEAYAGESS